MWVESAMAMAGAGQAQPQGGAAGLSAFLPIIGMVLIFYWLLIRPQIKEKKQHQEMIGSLKRGDKVITTGGVLGKVVKLSDVTLTVEVGPKVQFEILRSAIRGLQNDEG